jgi:hypothetical protein
MKLLPSLTVRVFLTLVVFLVSAQAAAGTYSDAFPTKTVYYTDAQSLSLNTSASSINSTESFTLTLTGSYVTGWPIEEYYCLNEGTSSLWCYENLYGLEVSTDNGATWNIVPNSHYPSFWIGGTQHTFTGMSPGTYLYRAVELYFESYIGAIWNEIYYSPTHLQVTVSGVGGAPSAPPTLTVPSSSSMFTIEISWGSATGSVVEYRLEQQKNGGGYTEIFRGSSSVTSATVTGEPMTIGCLPVTEHQIAARRRQILG